jgi:hypothetical protein
MRHHPTLDLGEVSMRVLIEKAKRFEIKNYSRLTRDELIFAIKECQYEKDRNADRDNKLVRPDEVLPRTPQSSTD